MYVSGLLLCYVGAEVINSPMNLSVRFVKEKDMNFFASDYWKIIVDYDLSLAYILIMCLCTMR
jgi:hypothetical protein